MCAHDWPALSCASDQSRPRRPVVRKPAAASVDPSRSDAQKPRTDASQSMQTRSTACGRPPSALKPFLRWSGGTKPQCTVIAAQPTQKICPQ
eukprot:1601827-Prymnesium_polylepis.2